MKRHQFLIITIGCFLSYFLFGFVDNMKGPTLPYILEDAGYSYTKGGTIIFSEYTGFFIATFLAGVLADWLGKKFTLVIAGVCLILGVAGYALSSNIMMFIVFIFFIGLGLGSLELSGSNIISGIYNKSKGKYLNLLNAFYGIGSIAAPILTGSLLSLQVSWRLVYRYSLFIIIPITVYLLIMRYPKDENYRKKEEQINLKELVSKREVLLMYVVVFAYVAAEIGVATWLVEFLQKMKGISAVTSSLYLSVHFAGMTIGRLLGSMFVDKIGHLKCLLIFTGMAIGCITIGVFGPASTAIVLSFTGFCFSIIFPTSTAVVSETVTNSSGTMLGVFFAFGGLGGMAGPWMIGLANDSFGLKTGMSVNILFCAIIAITLIILMNIRKKSKIRIEH